jgi:hypothetical protein
MMQLRAIIGMIFLFIEIMFGFVAAKIQNINFATEQLH